MSVPFDLSCCWWTPERLERARAMRQYRQSWARCDEAERWSLECLVYTLRGRGLAETAVGQHVRATVEEMRPWRMSDAKLGRALLRRRKKA